MSPKNNRTKIGIWVLAALIAFWPMLDSPALYLATIFVVALLLRLMKPVESWMTSYTIHDYFNPKPKLTMVPVTDADIDSAMNHWLSKYRYITKLGSILRYKQSLGFKKSLEVGWEDLGQLLSSIGDVFNALIGLVLCVAYFTYACIRLPFKFVYWLLFRGIADTITEDVVVANNLIKQKGCWPKRSVCETWYITFIDTHPFYTETIVANNEEQAVMLARQKFESWWVNRSALNMPEYQTTISGDNIIIQIKNKEH